MAETIPGGRYQRADGVFVDANGHPLPEEVQAPPSEPAPPRESEHEAVPAKKGGKK